MEKIRGVIIDKPKAFKFNGINKDIHFYLSLQGGVKVLVRHEGLKIESFLSTLKKHLYVECTGSYYADDVFHADNIEVI